MGISSFQLSASSPLLRKEGWGEVDPDDNLSAKSSRTPSKLFTISSLIYRIT